ncbi:MAG: hypothetical protein HFF17_02430 [Oscillospiraceae bacterium]|nr:hypothetical protein [Oscillospiraceae bacterium]
MSCGLRLKTFSEKSPQRPDLLPLAAAVVLNGQKGVDKIVEKAENSAGI